MMILYVGNIMTFMDIGKYVILYIFILCISYELYDDFWVSLCMHPRRDDDSLETAKNVLAVRLV
jgi:hypothetical protein